MLTVDRETFELLLEWLRKMTTFIDPEDRARELLSLLGLQAPETGGRVGTDSPREGWLRRSLEALEANPPRGQLHPDDPCYIPPQPPYETAPRLTKEDDDPACANCGRSQYAHGYQDNGAPNNDSACLRYRELEQPEAKGEKCETCNGERTIVRFNSGEPKRFPCPDCGQVEK